MPDSLHRLHPATILVELFRRLGSMAYLIAVALILRFFGAGGRTEVYEYAIAGLMGFSVIGAVLRYLTLRFGVQDRHLVIQSGLIFYQHRTIPLERIQNVSLRRGLLHRMLGVVDLDVETAGGATPEARLSALGTTQAEQMKRELVQWAADARGQASLPASINDAANAPAAATTPPEPEPGDLVWSSSLPDLLLAGATENRVGVIVAGFFGIWYTFQDAIQERFVESAVQRAFANFEGHAGMAVLVVLGGVLLLVIVGWMSSIAMTCVNYYGFQVRRTERGLRLKYGLLTQHEKLLPVARVQCIRLEAPWLRRLVGCVTVWADTAGSVVEKQSAESTPLCPLLRTARLPDLLRPVFPALDITNASWRPVSRLTIRRGFIRLAALALVLSSPLLVAFLWVGLAVLAILLAAAAWLAFLRYRALGYAELDEFVMARGGVFTRRTWIIPRTKIQWIELVQTPFQSRLELASIVVHTAGGLSRSATIVDLPEQVAFALQDRLSERANETGLVLDGV
jgi:putative membrane protein